ncbi:hypothetical protein B4589_004505 [Halolamina sp. CBA1230]|uniref:hypothetical protein n=1 Tax=Halolamina sp. CBA1230 TaxID=1853690 RepID=UPI0009A23A47|nr:hypothetical protein [Halolamina sp. CBA1230]QKY19674.1 hypothetical protein B4589_004505 [Halolamina sp. CBA1230]
MTREQVLDASHLPGDVAFPDTAEDLLFPDVYVGLEIDLLAPGDGVVTDRHHASADRYEADDPMNQIEGQISPFTLSGWLRHGCEEVVQIAGATACHPGEANADFMRADVYDRDLESGYHEKGACLDEHDAGCVVYDVFGGFGDQPGKLLRRPVSFSPIRRNVDVLDGEAEAHFRQVSNQVRSRNAADGGQPLRHAQRDVLGNVEGTWKLTLRDLKPEFVGLLVEAVSFLDAHSDEYAFQIGGARNFGAGIADAWIVNPLYTEQEVRRVFHRGQAATTAMEQKDETWRSAYRPVFVEALQARVAKRDGDVPVPDGDTDGEDRGDGA